MFNFSKIFNKETNSLKLDTTGEEKELQDNLKRMAYSESEMNLGTNPSSKEQADVYHLNDNDFDYISKVETLAKNKLNDPTWIKEAKEKINKKPSSIKSDDELFKSGRGILQSHTEKNYGDNR